MTVPDYADDRPVYIQIADDIRAAIKSGQHVPGNRLPSNRELSEHYHVAYETIRQALGVLRDDKLVSTQSTRGTFVLREAAKPKPSPEYLELAEQIRRLAERMDAMEARMGMSEQGRGQRTTELSAVQDLRRQVEEQQQFLIGIRREVQDDARLLARMRRRLEEAGITLADVDRPDAQAL
jgi:DNA-binding transcriptional regulator YhcF (GntR family)